MQAMSKPSPFPPALPVRPPDFAPLLKHLPKIAIAVLLLVIVLGSYYTVPADSVAVITRFGALKETRQPGLHFKIPLGVDRVEIVPVRRQLKHEFGFASVGGTGTLNQPVRPELLSRENLSREKSMITGDLNAALVSWVVQYRITDPEAYLFKVREPEDTLRAASECVMREVVGDRLVDEVITVGRQEVEHQSREKLQQLAELYLLGISIDQVQLKDVDPPEPVQESFSEVNQAQQEREKMVNVARGEYNKAVPRAKGEGDQKISEAEGYALKRTNEALGDATRFDVLFKEYQKAPAVTRQRMYLETMAELLPRLDRQVIIDSQAPQIVPYLPLQPPTGPARSTQTTTTPRR